MSNIAYTSKKYVSQLNGDTVIKLFARTLLSYPNWNSPFRRLKWNRLPILEEKIVIKRGVLTTTLDKQIEILKTDSTRSNYGVFRLCPFDEKGSEEFLPTPLASDGSRGGQVVEGKRKRRKSGQVYSSTLQDLATSGLLPTPTCMDAKGNVTNDRGYYNLTDYVAKVYNPKDVDKVGGTNMLSPRYVEEMMGFPKDWTLEPFLPPYMRIGEEKDQN